MIFIWNHGISYEADGCDLFDKLASRNKQPAMRDYVYPVRIHKNGLMARLGNFYREAEPGYCADTVTPIASMLSLMYDYLYDEPFLLPLSRTLSLV